MVNKSIKLNTKFLFSEVSDDLDQLFQENSERWSSIFILVDTNTHENCLPLFLNSVNFDDNVEILEIEAGEKSKDIEIATGLWMTLSELNADRKSLIINLGGGVVCDLGAWVAANYKRGIDFIHVPTTLLAMIDASIGGKTGIDMGGIKNLVGSFSLPHSVLNHPPFLNTLVDKEWYSGFAEMIKHGLIDDNQLWNKVKSISPKDHDEVKNLIQETATIKINVVKADFKEKGDRKKLNFGHTIGHAIEAISIERDEILSHGHCVAIGMVLATLISHKKGVLDDSEMKLINDYILKLYTIPNWLIEESDRLIEKVQKDKKNIGDVILMVLLTSIGEAIIDVEVEKDMIKEVLIEISNDRSVN